MSTYAEVSAGTCTNVVVCDDPAHAQAMGWTLLDGISPQPGIDWTFDGTTWTAPAPDPALAALAAAQGSIDNLLAASPALAQQIATDAAMFAATPVGSALTAEHIAAFGRIVDGFATTMQAITGHLVLTGNAPPTALG